MRPDIEPDVRSLMARGGLNGIIIQTDDCRAAYAELVAKGVEFTSEPEEVFYGIDCGFRDPFGNGFRLTQIADVPGPRSVELDERLVLGAGLAPQARDAIGPERLGVDREDVAQRGGQRGLVGQDGAFVAVRALAAQRPPRGG